MFAAAFPVRFCLGSGLETMVGGRQVHTLIGHTDEVWSVSFSPNGNRVVSGSWDRDLKIWNAETGTLVSSFVVVQ